MKHFLQGHKVISILAVVLLGVMFSYMRISHPHNRYFSYDNFGYYMYLPAMFIYDDIKIDDFSWVEDINKKYDLTPTYFQFSTGPDKNQVIRFFMGMSIMYAPGFAVGHLIALNSDEFPADGFSKPYARALLYWGLLLQILGLIFLRKVLLYFFNDTITAITLLVMGFGTILWFFSTYGNDAPHVYLFNITAILAWLVIKWHQQPKTKYAIAMGFFKGLLVISRPSEITIFFFMLLWGVYNKESLKNKVALLWKHKKQLLFFALSGLIFAALQMTYWQIATGKPLFFPYTDTGSALDLSNPRFLWVLFSFRKGLLVYSPLIILSMVGFIFLYKNKRESFWAIFVVFILNLYIIASFSSLISYGYRAFLQGFPLLAIPMGFTLQYIFRRKVVVKIVASLLIIIFSAINIFQAWQITMGIIHGSRMTSDYYYAVFLKDHVNEEDRDLLLIERSSSGIDIIKNEKKYNRRILELIDFEKPIEGLEKFIDTSLAYNGKYSFRMETDRLYSPLIKHKYKDITDDYYAWIRASVKFYPTSAEAAENIFLAISFNYQGKGHKWRALRSNQLPEPVKINEWNTMTLDYLTPEMRSVEEELRVFVWNPNKVKFYIDDFKVEVFERKR